MAPTRAHACNDRPETKTLWLGGSVRTHLCPSFVGIGKSRVMTQVRETKKSKNQQIEEQLLPAGHQNS